MIREVPEVTTDFGQLRDHAGELRHRAAAVAAAVEEADGGWAALAVHYREPATEDRVLSAVKQLPAPAADFHAAVGLAAAALEDFADQGVYHARYLEELRSRRASFNMANPDIFLVCTDDPWEAQAREAGRRLDEEIRLAVERWEALQQSCADALNGIRHGRGEGLGNAGSARFFAAGAFAAGTAALGAPARQPWSTFGARFDRSVQEAAGRLAAGLAGKVPGEVLDWARNNPQAAALLAANRLPQHPVPGSAEAALLAALSTRTEPRRRIDVVRAAFLGLAPAERERMALQYPGILGVANGVPFAHRVLANKINAVAERQKREGRLAALQRRRAELPEPKVNPWAGRGAATLYLHDLEKIEELESQIRDAERAIAGYDWAIEHNRQLVLVSDAGDGRYVDMRGTFGGGTENVFSLVPGTGADISKNQQYAGYLDNLYAGTAPERTVGLYWMGADLPDEIPDNITDRYSREGADELAEFGYAADLESPPAARTTTISYSAGASLHGAAETRGYATDNVIYVAPAGPGPDVHDVGDTANPDARRYWIQTRDDPISWAQLLGHHVHGGSPAQLDVVRLESGYVDKDNPSAGLLGGHVSYFDGNTTAVENMRAVINGDGTEATLHVPHEVRPGYRYPIVTNPLVLDPTGFDDWRRVPAE